MFMVAASVVTTILILNYHHRKTETHEMPQWVSGAGIRAVNARIVKVSTFCV